MDSTVALSHDVKALTKAMQLIDGKLLIPPARFTAWREKHEQVDSVYAQALASELLAVAIRFHREGGKSAAEAIAQLYMLCADLIGRAAATQSFRDAGVAWRARTPSARPARKGGWVR
jgi:hypothetical protein